MGKLCKDNREIFRTDAPQMGMSPKLDSPRASYRAENPTNPKIGQKYQPDIQIPPTAGDRQNTPKIPEKYPKKYELSYFLSIPGGI